MHLLLGISLAFDTESRFFGKPPTGIWLVVVGNEVKTRTLTIKSIGTEKDGVSLAYGEYGYTGGKQSQVIVKLWKEGRKTNLSFDSPAKSSIIAAESTDGSFAGTFINKKGTRKTVLIKRANTDIENLRYLVEPQSKISVVYFKSYNCIYCTRWESHDKERFIKMEEYAHLNFITVNRDNSEIEQLPNDLKWLVEKHETGRGSPYFTVLVNQTIVLKAFGKDNWGRMVIPLLKSLVEQKKHASFAGRS